MLAPRDDKIDCNNQEGCLGMETPHDRCARKPCTWGLPGTGNHVGISLQLHMKRRSGALVICVAQLLTLLGCAGGVPAVHGERRGL